MVVIVGSGGFAVLAVPVAIALVVSFLLHVACCCWLLCFWMWLLF